MKVFQIQPWLKQDPVSLDFFVALTLHSIRKNSNGLQAFAVVFCNISCFFYKLFFLLWRTLLVSSSLTASDNKQGIKKFIWSQISWTVVCIDFRALSWLQNTLILNQCQSDCISVTVLLCHLPVHVYYRTILSLSYFPTFFSDSNPTTPSKKIPYLRLALGKRPKWHLGRFILEGWAPWYTCGSLLTQGPNKPSLCLNRNFKCNQRYIYRVIYKTVLKTDQSNTRNNLNFCHLCFGPSVIETFQFNFNHCFLLREGGT